MNNKKHSQAQEKTVKEILQQIFPDAKRVSGSGSPEFTEGDVKAGNNILVECKTVSQEQKQQTIKKEDIEKVSQEAFSKDVEIPALAIDFGQRGGKNYFIVEEIDFINLLYNYFFEEE